MGAAGKTISGRCLCGAVKFSADVAKHDVDACHCSMCRRWSAGPFMGLMHEGEATFDGADNIGVYKSSDWGERAFCKVCGTPLFWRLSGSNTYSFSAGALDDQSGLRFTMEIFVDEKPAFYDFANDTLRLTGAEAMAALAGGPKTE